MRGAPMSLFRRASWVLVLLTAASCSGVESSETLNPIGPDATPPNNAPTPPRGGRTISGVITERTASGAQRPLAAQVNAWVDTGRFGYSYMWANGPRTSGADGRYELTELPDSARVIVEVYKEGYFQQCAAPPVQMTADAAVDVELDPSGAGIGVTGLCYKQTGIPFHFWRDLRKHPYRPPAGSRPVCGLRAHGFFSGRLHVERCERPLSAVWNTERSACQHRHVGPASLESVYIVAPPGQTTGVDLVLP